MNLYEEYDQERKSTLSEAEAFERSAMDCGDWDLASTCETTKVILEDIRILVVEASEQKKDDNCENTEKKQRHKRDRKCRFYNRGFCKFGRSCNFGHPQLVCKEYLEDGICRQRQRQRQKASAAL